MKQVLFVMMGLALLAIIAFFSWPEQSYEPYVVSEAYRAQVDKFNIPDMPDDWTWDRFASEDGIEMRYGQTGNIDFRPRDGRHASRIHRHDGHVWGAGRRHRGAGLSCRRI